MNRYLIKKDDEGYGSSVEHFIELGVFRFWRTAMRGIDATFPPTASVDTSELAFRVLSEFVKTCGSSLVIDLRDGCNTDHFDGVEQEDDTIRLIWYSVDKNDPKRFGEAEVVPDEIVKVGEQLFGKNLEDQYGFTFDKMVITPAYLLLYSKEREIPQPFEVKDEYIKRVPDSSHRIYEHLFGSYSQEPILQYLCRYYCDPGLVAVVSPKGSGRIFKPQNLFTV
jgi:hypothetical protein